MLFLYANITVDSWLFVCPDIPFVSLFDNVSGLGDLCEHRSHNVGLLGNSRKHNSQV